MSYVRRWTFVDQETDESVTVLLNPNEMGTGTDPQRNLDYAWGTATGQHQIRAVDMVRAQPHELSFSGSFLTQEHYEQLLALAGSKHIQHVTDHLGRTFEILIQKVEFIEKLPTSHRPWRGTYTMTCMLLRRI